GWDGGRGSGRAAGSGSAQVDGQFPGERPCELCPGDPHDDGQRLDDDVGRDVTLPDGGTDVAPVRDATWERPAGDDDEDGGDADGERDEGDDGSHPPQPWDSSRHTSGPFPVGDAGLGGG